MTVHVIDSAASFFPVVWNCSCIPGAAGLWFSYEVGLHSTGRALSSWAPLWPFHAWKHYLPVPETQLGWTWEGVPDGCLGIPSEA